MTQVGAIANRAGVGVSEVAPNEVRSLDAAGAGCPDGAGAGRLDGAGAGRLDGAGDGCTDRASPDAGSAPVWVLCACLAVWSAAFAFLAYGGAVVARHRAAAAADLAALAAADSLLAGAARPCAAAAVVATRHGARLASCVVATAAVRVVVSVPVPIVDAPIVARLQLPPAFARAAAGAPATGSVIARPP